MVFDCEGCGACCLACDGDLDYVAVRDQADARRIEQAGRGDLLRCADGGVWLRTKPVEDFVACAALTGQPGEACSCSIYDIRPQVCRDFEPGSALCLMGRANVDLPLR